MSRKISFFPYMGGKYYMLNKLLKIMPPHRVYVEVFGGSAKLLLNKDPSKLEVYNDYDKRIANLFFVATFKFDEFQEKVNRILFSRAIHKEILDEVIIGEVKELGDVDMAVKTYFKLHASFVGDSKSKTFKPTFTKNVAREFFNNIDKLPIIHERLKNVIIECLDYQKILKKYKDIEDAFIYADPPYYGLPNYYGVNFTNEDQKKMLDLLKQVKGKWLLSGYANELYDTELKDFYRIEIPLSKHAYALTETTKPKGNTKPMAVEVLWANYNIEEMLNEKA